MTVHLKQFARVGTEKTNFTRASEYGPGGCGHCSHMKDGGCNHPEVNRDPALADEEHNKAGNVLVKEADRCEYWREKSKPSPAKASGMRGK